MTVIDIRNIFTDRNIELVDVTPTHVYYAEEKNNGGHNDLFLLEYNRSTRRERLITNYTLDDPTFVEHIFSFEETMVIILENGSNSLWLIEINKKSGVELNRRKIVCTGEFKNCIALDSEHILIYMAPDSENYAVFEKYKEVTGSDCLCYLYNLKNNQKYFVRSSLIARLGVEGIRIMDVHGQKFAVLLDPFADEDIKENYYREQRWINADIRDNLWLCRLGDLVEELESGTEDISLKSIASADIKALVRYMGIGEEKIYFRAKEFRNGTEKICSYNAFVNTLEVEADISDIKDPDAYFIIDEKPFKTFNVTAKDGKYRIKGIVNSEADITYDSSLGRFLICMDNRYVVSEKTVFSKESGDTHTYYYIYDSKLKKHESYECKCHIKGGTVVLY